ncbi:unnamed protein product [Auanema sp. JU1783]|nr:unnamed protein product [Auanema sp. JU1783]
MSSMTLSVQVLLAITILSPNLIQALGISRHRDSLFAARAMDSPIIDSVPCTIPKFVERLPTGIREKIQGIWKDYDGDSDCWLELARTRNALQLLSPEQREQMAKEKDDCKPPDVVEALPPRAQKRILEIWKDRDPTGDCWQQQRKTRLILLNLPASLRYLLHPPAFECAVPHFIDRLEWDLQIQLRRIWDGYKIGDSCAERVDQQLSLLAEHEISLESFQMPPPSLFRRYELLRKLKRASRA